MPRLRRSDCATPGISRRRRGRAVEYIDPDGARIDDPEVLERIGELAIPPAWRDVWICMDPQGHLQATGIDAAGRKQYLYHERWRAHRDRLKFDSMTAFGSSLPRLRRRVAKDLRGGEELTRERVLACVVRLLDLGFFRIGSEDYAERNESYGLTTMLKRHVSVRDGALVFDYLAKSGIRRVQEIRDEETLEIVRSLRARRGGGAQLFVHRSDGRWADVHSDEVNEYVKQASGGEFTAKDFRTWNATVLAAVALAVPEIPSGRTRRERVVRDAVKTVAAYLGNTPAVCRASYIDPRVIDRYHAGVTISDALAGSQDGPDLDDTRTRKRVELAVLELLD